jgi:hypothetical protein
MEAMDMGSFGNGDEKRGKRRGTTNNASRLAGLQAGGKPVGKADWGNANPEWIAAVVVGVTLAGGAVSFTLSRDQGAHGVTLMLDGERTTLWFNGDADLNEELEKVFAWSETLR